MTRSTVVFEEHNDKAGDAMRGKGRVEAGKVGRGRVEGREGKGTSGTGNRLHEA